MSHTTAAGLRARLASARSSGLLRRVFGLFPLTQQGLITLVVAAGALSVFGYGAMDLVVFALAICALAILVFALFCATISGIIMQRRIQRELDRGTLNQQAVEVEAGYPNETGFTLPALQYLPLIRLQWHIEYPDHLVTRIDHNGEELIEEIVPERRCLTERIVRRFTVADVLGFCRYSWRQEQALKLQALPKIDHINKLPLLRSLTSEDGVPNPGGEPQGDRMEIRRYAPGDSVRNIMWKTFARSRQLNVRLPEKSVFHSQRTVAYLLSSPNDEAAAAVARLALESGALGEDWCFGADGSSEPCSNLPAALRAVARSRAIDAPHAYGLDAFLDRAAVAPGSHCILFAAAEQADWLGQLAQSIARLSGHVSLILATDGLEAPPRPSWWQRLLFRDPTGFPDKLRESPVGRVEKPELLGLLTEVGHLVESTLIIDRKTGLSFDRQLRRV